MPSHSRYNTLQGPRLTAMHILVRDKDLSSLMMFSVLGMRLICSSVTTSLQETVAIMKMLESDVQVKYYSIILI